MIYPPPNDMLVVSFSPEGTLYMKKSLRLTLWVCGFFWLVNIAQVVHGVINMINYLPYNEQATKSVRWFLSLRVYPVYTIVAAIASMVSIMLFYRFLRLCNEAIDSGNTELFNHSFRWLYRNTLVGIGMGALSGIMALAELYLSVDQLKNGVS